ncbi:uncharacterized protein LOC142321507 [Lycorma delicatula]|uniref:uncharacterized protein LOC142321507 n=1 Tax=Lycorma delicatula TaxID=130591 RepID=UPI003F518ACE
MYKSQIAEIYNISYLIILLTFCSISAITAAVHDIKEKLLDNVHTYKDNLACSAVYSCANCTAVRICRPNSSGHGYTEYKTANCTGTTPYCDPPTGTCVKTPTINCANENEYVCLQDGTFPHPSDCTKYYKCKNLQSYSMKCTQSYYYYDSAAEECTYYKGCYSFQCSGYNGYKKRYPNDASIYSFCINGIGTVVDRCYGSDLLNETSQQCEPVCRYEGLIPDTSDCTQYYRCNKVPNKSDFIMTHVKCPEGEAYSSYEFRCVSISKVPSCQSETSITTAATFEDYITSESWYPE